jgi:putative ABC transport system substrate-binding protein
MRRRDFIALLGGAAAWPLAAWAQQAPLSPHIGVLLNAFSPGEQAPQAFLQGLRDAGYSVGGDVVIEWRAAHGDRSRLTELAADLVQRKVDVVVVDSTPGAEAAKNTTSAIPIVLALVADPVGSGLVASLPRPGGNVTGLSMMTPDLTGEL